MLFFIYNYGESPCTSTRLAHLQPHFSGQRLQHRAVVVFLLEALHRVVVLGHFLKNLQPPLCKKKSYATTRTAALFDPPLSCLAAPSLLGGLWS